jgi:molybdopterin synthase sulfur carrier subunit
MRVHIPAPLRKWTAGREVIELGPELGAPFTARAAIEALARQYPGIRDRVLDDQGELRRHVNIFIDGENARFLGGLGAQVGADSDMWIHPALSGGSGLAAINESKENGDANV